MYVYNVPSDTRMILTLPSTAGLPTHNPSGLDFSSSIFSFAVIIEIGSASVAPYITTTFLSLTVLAMERSVCLCEKDKNDSDHKINFMCIIPQVNFIDYMNSIIIILNIIIIISKSITCFMYMYVDDKIATHCILRIHTCIMFTCIKIIHCINYTKLIRTCAPLIIDILQLKPTTTHT